MATESFFSSASLAYLASAGAGKDGKAYSIKPTDGTGDFTFSRGSNLAATRVGADGLIEKGRENLLLQSNAFTTTWTLGTGLTLTSGQSGYDGSSDAWLYADTATGNSLQQNRSTSGVQTLSIYAKAGTADGIRLRWLGGSGGDAYFNIADSSTEAYQNTNTIATKKEDAGGGWYRVSLTFNDSVNTIRVYVADGSTTSSVSGNISMQDAQLEIGLAATDYIESGATTGKAGLLEDEPRFDYSGGATCPSLLLEPSRTNLLRQSEYYNVDYVKNQVTITDNAITSPEGLQNASKLIPNSGTGGNRSIGRDYSGLSSIHTFSTFAKAGEYGYVALRIRNGPSGFVMFNLNDGSIHNINSNAQYVTDSAKIEDYGNGWYRCSASFDPSGSVTAGELYPSFSVGITGDEGSQWDGDGVSGIYIYGSQFEAGSYPTSYIPNHSGGTITRGGDVCNGAGDASTFNDSEGVLYAEISALADDQSSRTITLTDGTFDERIQLSYYTGGSNQIRVFIKSGGTFSAVITTTLTDITEFNKIAYRYKSGETKLFINGSLIGTSADTFSITGLNVLQFANGDGLSNPLQGKAKQLLVFKEALSDTELIKLTTI